MAIHHSWEGKKERKIEGKKERKMAESVRFIFMGHFMLCRKV